MELHYFTVFANQYQSEMGAGRNSLVRRSEVVAAGPTCAAAHKPTHRPQTKRDFFIYIVGYHGRVARKLKQNATLYIKRDSTLKTVRSFVF